MNARDRKKLDNAIGSMMALRDEVAREDEKPRLQRTIDFLSQYRPGKPLKPKPSKPKKPRQDFLVRVLDALDAETVRMSCATRDADRERSTARALLTLLRQHLDVLPPLDGHFHKLFRSVDVVEDGTGSTDNAIWHLLNASTLFWEVYAKTPKRVKKTKAIDYLKDHTQQRP